jgi:hypothetical protein
MNAKAAVRPKRRGTVRSDKARTRVAKTGSKAALRCRARIEALFDELTTDRLAGLWQRLYALPVKPDCELPNRRGMIGDLADFGQVLQPNADGLTADQLCRLVDKCGGGGEAIGRARERRRASPYRLFQRGRGPYRHDFVFRAGCEL